MGLLALLALLCGGALVSKVTWPQAIEAESIVSHDGLHPYKGYLAVLHATQYSSTLAAYDGLVTAFFSGGGTWRFLSPSWAKFSPTLACKSENSSKSSKSGTVLELCVCHCHSNLVVWSSLSSSIDVTNEAKVSYFITLIACRCCLATSWRRRSSLLLLSFKERASKMTWGWARCITCTRGWL